MVVSSNFMLVTPLVKASEFTRQFQLESSVKIGGQAKQRDTHKLIPCFRGGLGVSSAALLDINEPTRDTCLCFQRSSEQSSHFCQTWDNQTPSPGKSAFVSSTAHFLSLIDKFCLVSSGKYLFVFPEQEAHPSPDATEKLQQAYPLFQSSFLIHIHCLSAQMLVSLAGNALDVCCGPSRGWESFSFWLFISNYRQTQGSWLQKQLLLSILSAKMFLHHIKLQTFTRSKVGDTEISQVHLLPCGCWASQHIE